jgi:hypothetical protein
MTLRLTKTPASVSLPRSQNVSHPKQTAKSDAVPRQGNSVRDGFEATARIRERIATNQTGRIADQFEGRERIRKPWNQETYGEKLERNRGLGEGAPTTVGGHPIPERYLEPWNQETYGEKFERNSRD